jgi:hypothetical protein
MKAPWSPQERRQEGMARLGPPSRYLHNCCRATGSSGTVTSEVHVAHSCLSLGSRSCWLLGECGSEVLVSIRL